MRLTGRLLSFVVAAALLAAGALGAVESIRTATGGSTLVVPTAIWRQWLTDRVWSDGATTAVMIALVVGGSLLVVQQLWPRRPQLLATELAFLGPSPERGDQDGARGGPTDTARVLIDRRGLERRLADRAGDHEDVLGAKARVGRRTVRLVLDIAAGASPDRDGAEGLVRAELDDLRLTRRLKIRTKVRTRSERVA